MTNFADNSFTEKDVLNNVKAGCVFGLHPRMTINADNTKIDISSGTYRKYNSSTGKIEEFSWDALEGIAQDHLDKSGPWFYIELPGSPSTPITSSDVVQTPTLEKTGGDAFSFVQVGRPRNSGGVGVNAFDFPIMYGTDLDLVDSLLASGSLLITGCILTGSVGDLALDLTSGKVLRTGAGNKNIFGAANSPEVASNVTSLSFLLAYGNAAGDTTTFVGAPVTAIDPTNYNNGGVLTPLTNNTKFVNLFACLYLSTSDGGSEQRTVLLFYGKAEHSSLAGAKLGIKDDFEIPTDSGKKPPAVLGCLSVKKDVVDIGAALAGGTTAFYTKANKFNEF